MTFGSSPPVFHPRTLANLVWICSFGCFTEKEMAQFSVASTWRDLSEYALQTSLDVLVTNASFVDALWANPMTPIQTACTCSLRIGAIASMTGSA